VETKQGLKKDNGNFVYGIAIEVTGERMAY